MQGQEFGAILPNQQENTVDRLYDLRNQDIQNQRYQQQQENQNAKYLADKLNWSEHLTGSEYDPVIQHNGMAAQQEIMGMLKDKKPMTDILYRNAQLSNQIASYANTAKSMDDRLRAQAGEAAKQGADPNAYLKYAKIMAYHDAKTGNLRPLEEVDPNADYGAQAANKYAQFIYNDPKFLDAQIKAADKRNINPQVETFPQTGVKHIDKFTGEFLPQFNEMTYNGKPIPTDANGSPLPGYQANGMRIKRQSIPLTNGQNLDVADQGTYDYMTSHPAVNNYMNGLVQRKYPGVDPDSPEGKILKRKELFDYYKDKSIGYLMPNGSVDDPSGRDRMDFQKQMKEQSFENSKALKVFGADLREGMNGGKKTSAIESVIRGVNGEPEFSGGHTELGPNGEPIENITSFIKGGALNKGKVENTTGAAKKEGFAGVGRDESGNLWVKEYTGNQPVTNDEGEPAYKNEKPVFKLGEDGKPVPMYQWKQIPKTEEKDFYRTIAQSNGETAEHADNLYHSLREPHISNDLKVAEQLKGIPKKPNILNRIKQQFNIPFK